MNELIFQYHANPIFLKAIPSGIVAAFIGVGLTIMYGGSVHDEWIVGMLAGIIVSAVMSLLVVFSVYGKINTVKTSMAYDVQKILYSKNLEQTKQYVVDAEKNARCLVYYQSLDAAFDQLYSDKVEILRTSSQLTGSARQLDVNTAVNDFQKQESYIDSIIGD